MWSAIKRLVSSRKWLVAVGATVVSTGVILAGWDEAAAAELAQKIVTVVMTLAGLYIGGTALEDAAAKLNAKKDG